MTRLRGLGITVCVLGAALLLLGCTPKSSDDEVRVLQITAEKDGCTPSSLAAFAGEHVSFEVTNKSDQDRELEGIEGTKVEEVLIPKGRTRSIPFTVPSDATVLKLKCYSPAGPSTIIELRVAADADAKTYQTTKAPQATVSVRLESYKITSDAPSVAAGAIRFHAENTTKSDVHELAVLRVTAEGQFENTGEVEDLDPGKSGDIVLDLPPGKYQLACLIAKGEAKSPVDHYQQGMHIDFEVK